MLSKLINAHPPSWLLPNLQYETIMGSYAYGVSNDLSDIDIYGFCIPPREYLFPWEAGEIFGFGTQIKRFDQYQEHHIPYETQSVDVSIYNIVKYFQLCMENNPNMIDSLFTNTTCVLHSTKISNIIRDNRRLFLHKGCWHKFKGYAYSTLHKMSSKNPKEASKRDLLRQEFGLDTKYGMHVIRLILEVEQILAEGNLDLQRHHEQLKEIRRGAWTEERIRQWFADKEKGLEELYLKSSLPWKPPEAAIKSLLLNCLEEHYGKIPIKVPNKAETALNAVKEIIERYYNK